ncbi:primosomal protein N' [Streptomonospora wellingtoniae]|uniref:Probable replication restart protein PriA n=1 Tax=Streptomonospora wellingtoniae TaxID=3075544 RepID=A0ABU2KPB1_9ACTN|nr:primosomal protein N' [Streptomonospora sp. DSM 45055]MDT0301114.1 primosomal protein N' [Streptomonospora sp. DSM 45055]
MTPPPDPDEGTLFDVPRSAAGAAGVPPPEGRGAAESADAAGSEGSTGNAGRGAAGGGAKPARGAKRPEPRRPADCDPVARVAVDTPLPHLDRLFDYRVPESMDADAVPGCRVRVRFNGQLLTGFLVERRAESDFQGRLAYLHQVVSPEPVLTPEIAGLARAVADRYAGTFSDVLRLAVPPRHARVEKEEARAAAEAAESGAETAEGADEPGPGSGTAAAPDEGADGSPDGACTGSPTRDSQEAPADSAPEQAGPAAAPGAAGPDGGADSTLPGPEPGPWAAYTAGRSFLTALRSGAAPRAVWGALPGPDWAEAIAVAAATADAAGRGAVVVVPDGRDVEAVDAALNRRLGEGRHVALTAGLGPAERYRRWLAALRGRVRVVVGTRAAAFAPVHDLGLVVLWDDGDDVHAEPHAPYPHPRTVLTMRAHRAQAAALVGGFTRTTEGAQLVESGWAHPLAADRATVRERAPRVQASGDDSELARDEAARTARIPSLALRVAREAATDGPVLVQVPRRGYLASLACGSCRAPARCGSCQGPLAVRGAHAMPYCRWCGRIAGEWTCASCGASRMRAGVVGARRTAEELGRAFPALTVRTSGREGVLSGVGGRPALVVATPGAEPAAEGGYAAAVLLDGWALLGRADLRASEEALRRWCNAAALVRPAAEGGRVVVVADAQVSATQALVRWDPGGFAERELAERRELGFPPAVTMASVTGGPAHVREILDQVEPPASAELLGPVTVGGAGAEAGDSADERALLRVPRSDTLALAASLKAAASARSARKDEHLAQVRMDPLDVV